MVAQLKNFFVANRVDKQIVHGVMNYFAGFFVFFGGGLCGSGGMLNMRRRTSSGFGVGASCFGCLGGLFIIKV
jgi:hypothetical protein